MSLLFSEDQAYGLCKNIPQAYVGCSEDYAAISKDPKKPGPTFKEFLVALGHLLWNTGSYLRSLQITNGRRRSTASGMILRSMMWLTIMMAMPIIMMMTWCTSVMMIRWSRRLFLLGS